jgi:hypothetical protein
LACARARTLRAVRAARKPASRPSAPRLMQLLLAQQQRPGARAGLKNRARSLRATPRRPRLPSRRPWDPASAGTWLGDLGSAAGLADKEGAGGAGGSEGPS